VNAVSWAPSSSSSSPLLLATGSCDNEVRVWMWEEDGSWRACDMGSSPIHSDWVRDVSFSPVGGGSSLSSSSSYSPLLASCGEDRCVFVWRKEESEESEEMRWSASLVHRFEAPVWRVSWSLSGHVLAVSTGDQRVSMWKMNPSYEWVEVTSLQDNPINENVSLLLSQQDQDEEDEEEEEDEEDEDDLSQMMNPTSSSNTDELKTY